MKPSFLKILAVVFAASGFAFASAEIGSADPLASIAFSPLPGSAAQAGLVQPAKCVVKNNKLVCDIPGEKHKKQGEENTEEPPKKGSKKKEETGLENCTIISKQGGGGCKTGFKFVCEKMKSGKKCCGCVEDKNAKKDEKKDEPKVQVFSCTAQVTPMNTVSPRPMTMQLSGQNAAQAQSQFNAALKGFTLMGPIACTPVK